MADIQKEKKEKSTHKLTCVITGKTIVIVRSYFLKKVQDYGDEATLRKLYCSKQAKSMLKRGYSVDEIRAAIGKTNAVADISTDVVREILNREDSEEIAVPTMLETVNIHSRPPVAMFIHKLKQFQIN